MKEEKLGCSEDGCNHSENGLIFFGLICVALGIAIAIYRL